MTKDEMDVELKALTATRLYEQALDEMSAQMKTTGKED